MSAKVSPFILTVLFGLPNVIKTRPCPHLNSIEDGVVSAGLGGRIKVVDFAEVDDDATVNFLVAQLISLVELLSSSIVV